MSLPTNIRDDIAFGFDLGIGSLGWAVISDNEGKILAAGVRCFEVPEKPKDRTLKNAERRRFRLSRRVTRRRSRRKRAIRALLRAHGVALPNWNVDGLSIPDPWKCRAEGLSRRLEPEEFAAVLLHLAKRRGFKSNKKGDRAPKDPDSQKMLAGIGELRRRLEGHATVGALLANEPKKRNAPGEYSHTVTRDMIEDEARRLFARQHELGNPHATEALRQCYLDFVLCQLPLKDSEHMVGKCPFEPDELRAAACAYSFERFRYASRLAHLRVIEPTGEIRALSPEERARCLEDFGASKGVTFKALRKRLGLGDEAYFEGVARQDDAKGRKEKDDVAASRGAAFGTATLRGVVGEAAWDRLIATPGKLDEIAFVLSFREDLGNIREGLEALALDGSTVDAVVKAAEAGTFDAFKRAGNISAKAARKILACLADAPDYRAACVVAGYDPDAKAPLDIRNPVVKRAANEARKQFETLAREFGGLPDRVCVELARDVGKSPEERDKITRGIERRTAEREARRAELGKLLAHRFAGREPTDDDLLRYELWLEQEQCCIYTDRLIEPTELLGEGVQVDHILPRSRSQDNSYENMVLCTISANQEKRHKTPFEWMGEDPDRWHDFEVRVRNRYKTMRWRKKTRLLARSFDEEKYVARNLVDTRYAGKVFHQLLRGYYPDPAEAGDRRVFVRAGRITSLLRRAWGVDALKYDRERGAVARIADDRNHAVDAIVVAAAGEGALQRLTKLYQEYERTGRGDKVPHVPPPWETFRADTIAARDAILVSRSERRRARGAAHDATIYEIRAEDDGREVVYTTKSVEDLKESDLARIPDAERNRKTVEVLRAWIAGAEERKRRGKARFEWERERRKAEKKGEAAPPAPPEAGPRWPIGPNGAGIRKVTLRDTVRSGLRVRGGHADAASIVRTDVFRKAGKYYLVPIYAHQVADKKGWPEPPNRAIVGSKPEEEWTPVDETFAFVFSLYPDSYIRVHRKARGSKSERIDEGYYRGVDRSTGAITLSPHAFRDPPERGIGARDLLVFEKYSIDRLGGKTLIKGETRTWHGKVCT